MKHLNGKHPLVIDIRTTGNDPQQNEIMEVGALLLDHHFDIVQSRMPMQLLIRPSSQHVIAEDKTISAETMLQLSQYGQDHGTALDSFCAWLDRLPPSVNKYGASNKLILVGYKLHMKLPFLIKWMGWENFDLYFSGDFRDLHTAGLFMNDLTGSKMERVPFSKTTLAWLASKHNVPYKTQSKSCINTIRIIADTYNKLCWHSNVM
jgi:hypothetical protein